MAAVPRKILLCVDKSTPALYTAEWAFDNFVRPEDDVVLLSAVQVRTKSGNSMICEHFFQQTGTVD